MWDNDLNSIHKRRSYSTTFKIFLTSNSSRKLKNLHFFDDTFIFCSHFLFLCNMAYNGVLTSTQQKSHPETGAHAFLNFFTSSPPSSPQSKNFSPSPTPGSRAFWPPSKWWQKTWKNQTITKAYYSA